MAGRQSAAAKTAGYDTTSPTVAMRLNFQREYRLQSGNSCSASQRQKTTRPLGGQASRAKYIFCEWRSGVGVGLLEKSRFTLLGPRCSSPTVVASVEDERKIVPCCGMLSNRSIAAPILVSRTTIFFLRSRDDSPPPMVPVYDIRYYAERLSF